ncbi:uncharacterized protein At4g00950-like [Argentina anserina]|uniref:uncharacterized protein At4g00950-like n=1 Tax=Argentina anserina TaxID=57926 RepID=UPI00217666DB|nr:uncharacterized protein At4g00950-like [Potentilla anserina]
MEKKTDAVNARSPNRKLALFSLPSQPPEPAGMLTPPRLTSVSVPFQWEEAPGKPRHSGVGDGAEPKAKCARSLELPPRLLVNDAKVTNMSSPTTVFDGPEVGRTLSFSYALRIPSKEIKGGGTGGGSARFGSTRWSGFRKNKEAGEGKFVLLSTDNGGDRTKVKITRVRRKASFFNGTHQSRSHMWASIYESLKQVVSWRRRQDKLRKSSTVGYEPQNCVPIPTC